MMVDLEDFTTDQLRDEIRRREVAAREGRCWYCKANVDAHTCKYSGMTGVNGWNISPAYFIASEDCMGRPEQYYRAEARHNVLGTLVLGCGDSRQEATAKCLENIKKRVAKP